MFLGVDMGIARGVEVEGGRAAAAKGVAAKCGGAKGGAMKAVAMTTPAKAISLAPGKVIAAPGAKAIAAASGGLFGLGALGSVAMFGVIGLSGVAIYRYVKKRSTRAKPVAPTPTTSPNAS